MNNKHLGEFESGIRKLIMKLTRVIYDKENFKNIKSIILIQDDSLSNDIYLKTLCIIIIQIIGTDVFIPEKFTTFLYQIILSQ